MRIPFTKMHGLGNDFVVIHAQSEILLPGETIRNLGNRQTGIGFDQLLRLEPAKTNQGNVFYRIFNADGNEVEQCGNGARCIARLIGTEAGQQLVLEHPGGLTRACLEDNGDISVDLGEPDFKPESLPFNTGRNEPPYPILAGDQDINIHIVSIGNPHAVIFVDDVDTAPVATLGPLLESHEQFPNHANIGFMQVVAADRIRLRVYERGVGETRGCGTGACAAAVIGQSAGRLGSVVEVELPGGCVTVNWDGPGSPVWLTGEAVIVFEGTINI
ncbi:MAG: diaminopimelate epimerase [Gammaproteobacteria bacterium]|jgi:diaminopimelate epimerase|nr:diaminopimelate epimerase [Chromatiales bacterium]MCP4926700.1 diaminopimelate epimerase [Gammaproteobacteria bacterium]MDP7153771.1 diaminopimelate epimerase [Gammaproteobacteria bacterium]MDP7297075.1 diaminopimelate epimerase [Gammaproteobacteria bacterium]MDP7420075.1 diaminopimelate epimerase [Gammaproteobacteria bacterium]